MAEHHECRHGRSFESSQAIGPRQSPVRPNRTEWPDPRLLRDLESSSARGSIMTTNVDVRPDHQTNSVSLNKNVLPGSASGQSSVPQTTLVSEYGDECWVSLIDRLRANDPDAMTELYQVFAKGIRFSLSRRIGYQELDDCIHDAFISVVQSIRRGDLRDPGRLMGFVRTIVSRTVGDRIQREIQNRRDTIELENADHVSDQRDNPEKSIIRQQRLNIIGEVLAKMVEMDKELLSRFYVQEQSVERICHEMKMSDTQFRLLKSRAKTRFGDIGRAKLQLHLPDPISLLGLQPTFNPPN